MCFTYSCVSDFEHCLSVFILDGLLMVLDVKVAKGFFTFRKGWPVRKAGVLYWRKKENDLLSIEARREREQSLQSERKTNFSFLDTIAEHHNNRTILLHDHLPKMSSCRFCW